MSFAIVFIAFLSIVESKEIVISPSGKDGPSCGTINAPCESLDFVLSTRALNNTKVVLTTGDFHLRKSYTFTWLHNFHVTGLGKKPDAVKITCSVAGSKNNGSLAFVRSANIKLERFSLLNCGDWQSTTQITKKSISYKYFRFVAALYFNYCTNLVLSELIISKTPGLALNIYDSAGITKIYNCQFIDNRASTDLPDNETIITPDGYVNAGGAVFVQLTRFGSNSQAGSVEEHNRHVSDNQFYFINCSFSGNEAPGAGIYDPSDTPDSPFSRGGAIGFFLTGNASSNVVGIISCSFYGNRAQWGGGIQFEANSLTQNNSLIVKDTRFENNFALYAGGGARVGSVNPKATTVLAPHKGLFQNCLFTNNTSLWGGGVSIYGATRLIESLQHHAESNNMVFANCHWLNNKGNVGSAIAAFLWNLNNNGIGPTVPFYLDLQGCTFKNNDVKLQPYEVSLGQGAVYSSQVPIRLSRSTIFTNNTNSALALDSATVEIKDEVRFMYNRGYVGGAVSMYGRSKFVFYKKSKAVFVGNQCRTKGGAIFISTSGPPFVSFNATGVSLQTCFFVYEEQFLDFDNWDTEIIFQGNHAPSVQSGNSIYSTTLINCRRVGEPRSNNSVLEWKTVKFYDKLGNETTAKMEVSTDAINIRYNATDWQVAPGQVFNASVNLINEKGNAVHGIVQVGISSCKGSSNAQIGTSSSLFLSDEGISNVQIIGKERALFNVTLRTFSGPLIRKVIKNLKLKTCNPGFRLSGTRCICSSDIDDGVTYCSKDGLRVYIRNSYWAGIVKGKFITYPCPDNYCSCTNASAVNADECLFIEGKMCIDSRDGTSILCGKCKPGYSALIGTETCSSTCTNLYLLLLIPYSVILLLLVMVVMAINLDAFTGYLNAWLFSYQVISLLTKEGMPHFDPFITFVIGIANLQFKTGTGSCLVRGIDEADKLMMMYAVPTYVLLLVFVLAKVIRLYPNWFYSRRVKAPFRALCTLFVLCYTNITGLSLNILHFAKLGDRYVVYQNGELEFFKGKHIGYGLVAIAYILLVVIPVPLFLMFTPFFVKKGQKYFRINLNTFKPIYDALQGCFKDKYRWFSAFYFVCRLVLLLVATYIPVGPIKRSVLEALVIMILLFFVYLKPYQRCKPSERGKKLDYNWINKSDTILLTNLCFIVVWSSSYDDRSAKSTRDGIMKFVNALAYVPLIVLLVVIGRVFHLKCKANTDKRKSVDDFPTVTQELTAAD